MKKIIIIFPPDVVKKYDAQHKGTLLQDFADALCKAGKYSIVSPAGKTDVRFSYIVFRDTDTESQIGEWCKEVYTALTGETSAIHIKVVDMSKPFLGDILDAALGDMLDAAEKGPGELADAVQEVAEEPAVDGEFIDKIVRELDEIRGRLGRRVIGQNPAITAFSKGYFNSSVSEHFRDEKKNSPRAMFLFAGAPGVGKTFLAESVAHELNLPFKRFDMSEYAEKESSVNLVGSDAVYKDAQEGQLTQFVNENPHCILLFDEIEKAHLNVIHLFLQILDSGLLRDMKTRKDVSFRNTIVIFTTNAGKNLYIQGDYKSFSSIPPQVVMDALAKDTNSEGKPFFPAALCSRLATGHIVMFNSLTASSLCSIAESHITENVELFSQKYGIKLEVDENVAPALLYSCGGAADARMVSAKSDVFAINELYELFRLVNTANGVDTKKIKQIRFSVDIPDNRPEIRSLFHSDSAVNALALTQKGALKGGKTGYDGVNIIYAQDYETAKKLLIEKDITFIVLDFTLGVPESELGLLNIEDIPSDAWQLAKFAGEFYDDIPLCAMENAKRLFTSSEINSLEARGVGMVIRPESETAEQLRSEFRDITLELHRKKAMEVLFKSSNVLSFDSAQRVSADGESAVITLYGLSLTKVVLAEDSAFVLNNAERPNVAFSDVIGARSAKDELSYYVKYLKDPKSFLEKGGRAPKGLLLNGLPGTGKTLLARAFASQTDATFMPVSAAQFIKRYAGDGPDSVKKLFAAARRYAPTVIFIDEIDAIGGVRSGEDTGGKQEILNTLLVEMDGFKVNVKKPVFVLAATNFDAEGTDKRRSLDPALVRRFDRAIRIDLPDFEERLEYINFLCSRSKVLKLSDGIKRNIAMRSAGMSPAALELVSEIAIRNAIRTDTEAGDDMLNEAFETFQSGDRRAWSEDGLKRTARHEAGHTVVAVTLGKKPSYVTVVARGDYGGYMQNESGEDKGVYTRDELLDNICISMGGRAAEIVVYGEADGMSSGASGDLANASDLAARMLFSYGMFPEKAGLCVRKGERELRENDRRLVDELLTEQMRRAQDLIADNLGKLELLADTLISKNALYEQEILDLIG